MSIKVCCNFLQLKPSRNIGGILEVGSFLAEIDFIDEDDENRDREMEWLPKVEY